MHNFPDVAGVSVTHHFTEVNGLRYHYAEAGEGEPLILLHGWPQHWYMWHKQLPVLASKFRVICVDIRGFGWTETPEENFKVQQYAHDIVQLACNLGINKFFLAGHDWGGWIGFLICLYHPEKVCRYVSLNMPHPFQKPDSRLLTFWRSWYMLVISSPLIGPFAVSRIRNILLYFNRRAVNPVWTEDEIRIYTAPFSDPAKVKTTVCIYRTFLLKEFLPTLAGRYRKRKLTVPALILFGTRDVALSAKLLHGYEPYADDMKVELYPDAGHFIAEELPEVVSRRMMEFFE